MKRASLFVCIQKDDGETPPPEDHFIEHELELAQMLLTGYTDAATAQNVSQRIMDAAGLNNTAAVHDALSHISNDMSKWYGDTLDKKSKGILNSTYEKGLELAGALVFLSMLSGTQRSLVDGLAVQIKYFANNYFRRIVHPALVAAMQVNATSGANVDLVELMRQHLQAKAFDSTQYWKVVANQDVSRAHHYGILKGAQQRGNRGYQFVAVLDDRTTAVCSALNGREWWIADAVAHLERVAGASPENIATVSPWVTLDDIKGLTNDDLRAKGVIVPPLHALCRSTIKPLP